MKILLADERPVVLAGLRSFLDATEFEVVGESAAAMEILDAVRRFSPQCVLLDATKTAFDAVRIPENCSLLFFSTVWSRERLLQELRTQRSHKNDRQANRSFTPREFDVLCGITQGLRGYLKIKVLDFKRFRFYFDNGRLVEHPWEQGVVTVTRCSPT